MSAAMINFTLDGKALSAEPGETLWTAAKRQGIAIPHLCHMEGLSPAGNCRACVVEIAGERALAASCCRQPREGMAVTLESERVRKSQRLVLELLAMDPRPIWQYFVWGARVLYAWLGPGSFVGGLLIAFSLTLGICGYHWLCGLAWIDAFLDAAMILSGMGPLSPVTTTAGKFFAGCYAIYCGIALIGTTGVIESA